MSYRSEKKRIYKANKKEISMLKDKIYGIKANKKLTLDDKHKIIARKMEIIYQLRFFNNIILKKTKRLSDIIVRLRVPDFGDECFEEYSRPMENLNAKSREITYFIKYVIPEYFSFGLIKTECKKELKKIKKKSKKGSFSKDKYYELKKELMNIKTDWKYYKDETYKIDLMTFLLKIQKLNGQVPSRVCYAKRLFLFEPIKNTKKYSKYLIKKNLIKKSDKKFVDDFLRHLKMTEENSGIYR